MSKPLLGNCIGWLLSKTVYRLRKMVWGIYQTDRLIPSWAIGQTWGDYIFIRTGYITNGTILHESVHVEQWKRCGYFGFGFAIGYLWELIRHGYEGNRFEVEAREGSR
jgi:hypothetical protein